MLDDGLANILFVGRLAPNKRIEDHIRLAEHYKRYVDADYRLHVLEGAGHFLTDQRPEEVTRELLASVAG